MNARLSIFLGFVLLFPIIFSTIPAFADHTYRGGFLEHTSTTFDGYVIDYRNYGDTIKEIQVDVDEKKLLFEVYTSANPAFVEIDIAGSFGTSTTFDYRLPEPESIPEPESKFKIPSELKQIAEDFGHGFISDYEFLQQVQILINQGKLILPGVDIGGPGGSDVAIPEWVRTVFIYYAGGDISDKNLAAAIGFLFQQDFLPVTITDEPSYSKLAYEDQDSNDEIRFSGFIGPLINCESFSYEIPMSINSKTNVPVIIEIKDPQGKVAGRAEFDSDGNGYDRTIEMDWGKAGTYLIQVHYKGEIYQEDFTYDRNSPETYQGYRNSCLEQEYITSIRDETWTWFNWPSLPTHDGFYNNIKTAEELVRDSGETFWMSFVSERNINSTLQGETPLHDTQTSFSKRSELKLILTDGIERRVIQIFQDGESRITNNPDITLEEKTELIFELRKVRDNAVVAQRHYAEQYVESAYKIYQTANKFQELVERNKELTSLRIQADKEKELQITQEKESIRQEILSQNLMIPEWIKNNAKWWSEGTIGDNEFTSGIQFLIKEDIIRIPETVASSAGGDSVGIPTWIQNNASWWSQGQISDDDFLKGIQYLVNQGIIRV